MITRFPWYTAAAGAVLSMSLYAAEPTASTPGAAQQAEAADPEEQLDDGFKRFGYLAGLARGCVTESQRPTLEKEAVDLNGSITRLFGADRAFLFTAAFGYGTSVSLEVKECEDVLTAYDERVASFRARSAGAKP